MNKNICLIGNPNCGKTTLFNAVTGTYQRVGNFSGVTVDRKDGEYRKNRRIMITDLPGLYSLTPTSPDERAVTNYLKENTPDVIINVVDGTNLERSLFLTTLLLTLKIPMVIAVNMCDDLRKNHITLQDAYLSNLYDVPVVKISAIKNQNIDLLMNTAIELKKVAEIKDNLTTQTEIYDFISRHIDKIITKKQTRAQKFTLKADGVLTHKVWGIPIFMAVIILVYFLSSKIGGALGALINGGFNVLSKNVEYSLYLSGIPEWLISLVCTAILGGVGAVLSFLPQILVLFALLTVIEESGYASRIAFILDRIFRYFGLGGKCVLPLIVSCGCTVTGLMTARNIENANERKLTVFLSPFMPCGAKTAVFGWFSGAMFGGNPLISASAYFLSIFCVCVYGKILTKFKAFKNDGGGFLIEIPTLRLPSVKDVFFVLFEKVKDFTFKAGTVIFTISVILWFLQNVGIKGYTDGVVQDSFLFLIGNSIKYIFYPLGFGNWQSAVSVLTGLLAKEAVIQTLVVVSGEPATLFVNPFSAYAFMAFILLSPPCISALVTAKQELKSGKWFCYMLIFQTFSAYLTAFTINLIGKIYYGGRCLLLSAIVVIIISVIFIKCLRKVFGSPCGGCKKCGAKRRSSERCQANIKRNTTI